MKRKWDLEGLASALDLLGLVGFNGRADLGDLALDIVAVRIGELILVGVEVLLDLPHDGLSLVLSLSSLAAGLVSALIGSSLLAHALDLSLRETTIRLNLDALLLASGLVAGSDVHNAVSVNVEADLDLRDTLGGRGNANKVEATKELVVSSHGALTLENLDLDLSLVVRGSREDLSLLGGDGGVGGDELSEDTTEGLNTKGERGDVEKEHTLEERSN